MTVVFLLSSSTSPWAKPGDWTDTGHTVEMISPGGNGGAGSTGTSGRAGSGGGGGGYTKLTYSSGSLQSSTTFQVPNTNSSTTYIVTSSTIWCGTTATNSWEEKAGLAGANASSSTSAGGTFIKNGTPAGAVYTSTSNSGGTGGATAAAATASGGGGGGAGGPSGAGGNGGTSASGDGGGGGGAGNGGGSATNPSSTSGTVGAGTGGGTAGTSTASPAGGSATGTSSAGGGGGFFGADGTTSSIGGQGATSVLWTQTSDSSTAGTGGGGGGAGGNSSNSVGTANGGPGNSYGGGGGGAGSARGTGSSVQGGSGGQGLIVVTYTATIFAPVLYSDSQDLPVRAKPRAPDVGQPSFTALVTPPPVFPPLGDEAFDLPVRKLPQAPDVGEPNLLPLSVAPPQAPLVGPVQDNPLRSKYYQDWQQENRVVLLPIPPAGKAVIEPAVRAKIRPPEQGPPNSLVLLPVPPQGRQSTDLPIRKKPYLTPEIDKPDWLVLQPVPPSGRQLTDLPIVGASRIAQALLQQQFLGLQPVATSNPVFGAVLDLPLRPDAYAALRALVGVELPPTPAAPVTKSGAQRLVLNVRQAIRREVFNDLVITAYKSFYKQHYQPGLTRAPKKIQDAFHTSIIQMIAKLPQIVQALRQGYRMADIYSAVTGIAHQADPVGKTQDPVEKKAISHWVEISSIEDEQKTVKLDLQQAQRAGEKIASDIAREKRLIEGVSASGLVRKHIAQARKNKLAELQKQFRAKIQERTAKLSELERRRQVRLRAIKALNDQRQAKLVELEARRQKKFHDAYAFEVNKAAQAIAEKYRALGMNDDDEAFEVLR